MGPPNGKRRPSEFLDLPAELRNQIYQLVVGNMAAVTIGNSDVRFLPIFPLSLVSRQVRAEILPHLFDRRTICAYLTRTSVLNTWLDQWQDVIAVHLKHISIEDYQHYRLPKPAAHQYRCFSAIRIDLTSDKQLVTYDKDPDCNYCPSSESGVDRVNNVVQNLERVDGARRLTKEGMRQLFKAAAWKVSDAEKERLV